MWFVSSILAAMLVSQAEPIYQYVPVPYQVRAGSTLYTYWEGGSTMPLASDVFALKDVLKSLKAGDFAGIRELAMVDRLVMVPIGTPVKILQHMNNQFLAPLPMYEVRVLEGPYADQSGWVVTGWLRERHVVKVASARKAGVSGSLDKDVARGLTEEQRREHFKVIHRAYNAGARRANSGTAVSVKTIRRKLVGQLKIDGEQIDRIFAEGTQEGWPSGD